MVGNTKEEKWEEDKPTISSCFAREFGRSKIFSIYF